MSTDDSICESSLNPNKSSGDIGDRLKADALSLADWNGPWMKRWDEWRSRHANGYGGTSTREDFESLLQDVADKYTESAAEIERLRREVADAKFVLTDPAAFHLHALRNNVLSRMNALHIAGATDYDSLKARALTAESAVAAAWEEAAKIAETMAIDADRFASQASTEGCEEIAHHSSERADNYREVASAIRAAVSKKTAESGHSPSTHNSESE